ncbi:MAG: PorT family protein [Alistipes sp.]|nr:PorT family protein [Alistipes sp.]
MKQLTMILIGLGALLCTGRATAQHTLGATGGYGSGNCRLYPVQERRPVWGCYTGGLSWRYYGPQRILGGFGVDLEFLQRGFSYVPNASAFDDPSKYLWYTRRVNSLVLPVLWQPHVYLFRNRLRIFIDAAAYFSYNLSATYVNEPAMTIPEDQRTSPARGKYRFRNERDNRWGYGLAGGGGIAVLVDRLEFSIRARYYFGYSDLMRNRNKYANNATDGAENPFSQTPLRSPLDNLTVSVGIAYRFNRRGFAEWEHQRVKREKHKESFNYKQPKK